MTWWDLFSAEHCPNCFGKMKQPGHGLRRSTCEACHVTLPDALGLHLDRAMHSRWYVAWFQIAMRLLRRNEARQYRQPAAALPVVSTADEARIPQQKEGSAC